MVITNDMAKTKIEIPKKLDTDRRVYYNPATTQRLWDTGMYAFKLAGEYLFNGDRASCLELLDVSLQFIEEARKRAKH